MDTEVSNLKNLYSSVAGQLVELKEMCDKIISKLQKMDDGMRGTEQYPGLYTRVDRLAQRAKTSVWALGVAGAAFIGSIVKWVWDRVAAHTP